MLEETIQDLKKLDEIEKNKQEVINYLKDEIDTMGSGSSMFIVKTALQVVLEKLGGKE